MFALVLILLAAEPVQAAAPDTKTTFADLALNVTPPQLAEPEERIGAEDDQVRGTWSGKLGTLEVSIDLLAFPNEEWGFGEAGEVTDTIANHLRKRTDFDADEAFELEGPFGISPVLNVISGRTRDSSDTASAPGKLIGREFVAGGLLAKHGYALHIACRPEPDEAARTALLEFLRKGVRYEGPLRDPNWTLEEIEQRWLADAPDALHADFKRNLSKKAWLENAVLRTKHYLVMTNASGGKNFAKQMEANYQEISKIFPLPDGKGCKLMPVFLFRTDEDYYAYCVKTAEMSLEEAKKTAGHAWKDYYATWYNSPVDPTHIHEQVHQIFGNRLFLGGGGSWFQEGLAEYVESSRNDRNVIASLVEKGRHLPLPEFFVVQSLALSASEDRKEGGSEAADLYKQAALFIEFLRESKWGKAKFERFLQLVGRTPRGDLEKLRAVFQELYGVDLEQVDLEFQTYCAKR